MKQQKKKNFFVYQLLHKYEQLIKTQLIIAK